MQALVKILVALVMSTLLVFVSLVIDAQPVPDGRLLAHHAYEPFTVEIRIRDI